MVLHRGNGGVVSSISHFMVNYDIYVCEVNETSTCLKYTVFVIGVMVISVPLLPVGVALVFTLFYLIFPQVLCGNACTLCIDPAEKASYEETHRNTVHLQFFNYC